MRHVLAFPSWVIPGGVAENARFLAEKKETGVREIGLCLFESAACLAYGEAELPRDLRGLGFSWHAHLPFDLFAENADKAAANALTLMDGIAFLDARRALKTLPLECVVMLELFSWNDIENSLPALQELLEDRL